MCTARQHASDVQPDARDRRTDEMPYFRVRGSWLAQLGFKPAMRLYIQASRGQLVITPTDPAAKGCCPGTTR